LRESATGDIRVIFVHGMCTHKETQWIDKQWDGVIKAYFPTVTIIPETLPDVGAVKLYDREYHIGNKTISGRFLVWSPLTESDKEKLQFDNSTTYSHAPGEFKWKRATLNLTLKGNLLNDCLSDAVIYAGTRGTEIQSALEDAICVALDGTINSRKCQFPVTYAHDDRRIIIVTESLGSRIVFDAITDLEKEAKRGGPKSLAAFDAAVSPITQIFMLANQLPLLAVARGSPTSAAQGQVLDTNPTASMVSALKVLSEARKRHRTAVDVSAIEPSIDVIAFTDPNDLLSYRIPPGVNAILGPDAAVINVITSNDGALFGIVENPLTAHTTYDQNKDVRRLLFGGSTRERWR